ncbi:carboxylating nicotinate-nucleotide diphosphorylase [Candidatus Hydrogenedentota bacterium]
METTLDKKYIQSMVRKALEEDIPWGDVTTDATVRPETQRQARIVAREEGVLAGVDVARECFLAVNDELRVTAHLADGARVSDGDEVMSLEGSAAGILSAERTALNFVQRMSGVATLTARFVEKKGKNRARITDTRKTMPGMRRLDKYAVAVGGGLNHRFSLSDAVLIKDNHLKLQDVQRPIIGAVVKARNVISHTLRVEVEVETLDELEEALGAGADIILLDNMTINEMKRAVERAGDYSETLLEASGNVTLDNVAEIAATGVDIISIGALTHSAPAVDFSLEML